MRGELAEVGKGQVPLAPQNHRAQVAAAAQQAGQVGGGLAVFVQQVREDNLAIGGAEFEWHAVRRG